MRKAGIIIAAAAMLAVGCVEEMPGNADGSVKAPKIIAEMAETPQTRTCIDATDADNGGTAAVLWTPGDQLGVFTDGGSKNVPFTNDEKSKNVAKTSFSSAEAVSGKILYAYYPYDAEANAGKEATALFGEVPSVQTMGANIPADYKYAELEPTVENGVYRSKFHNLFSLVRFKIDATGTALAGEALEQVKMTVKRNGADVPITGRFTFSAVDGSYKYSYIHDKNGEAVITSPALTAKWENTVLNSVVSSFATVFPEIKSGDSMTFEITTGNYLVTFAVTSKADFESEMYYTLPLTLSRFADSWTIRQKGGTFTAASYNVKSSTSGSLGSAIAVDGWDFFCLSEDFGKLSSNLGDYTFGTRTKLLGDGLGFATLNSTCSFSNEHIEEYDSEYGSVLEGANTIVAKGFRYYLVTLKDGTQVDVYITHMNTFSGDATDPNNKHLKAQHEQLQELATYIKTHRNGRPVIFMGDTNCRYTRHDFETYFWSIIRAEGITISDPWVEYEWDGLYPAPGDKSHMVSDAKDTDASKDKIFPGYSKGEVVDKLIYINDANAGTQIKANGYLRDGAYLGKSDHLPIVVEFTYYK